ncbi:EexN family lipoprotein [Bartonella grahamii]|uniref:EexN family lipoprotein n=1 Tax=Bartonella grahamii TaxID=33045 RepID=UPI002E7BA04F|nr:EexN family lipoprotein [Bartonella grahamii]
MNKIIITTLLLCTGLITAGCEKTYSVAEFKKDKNLMEEWGARCGWSGTSKNCENLRVAALELEKERRKKAEEHNRKLDEEFKAKQKAWIEKMRAENEKFRAEQEAKERTAEEQQNNH